MTFRRLLLPTLLVASLVASGCNDDDSNVTGPQDNEQPGPGDDGEPAATEGDQASSFYSELNQALIGVFPILVSGEGQLAGAGGGRVIVSGTTMTFEDYSPDGATFMAGEIQIAIDFATSMWNINGSLTLSGESEGEAVVAMTLNPLATPLEPQGTVTIDGTEYDVAELAEENADG